MANFFKVIALVFGMILASAVFAVPYINQLSALERKSEIKIGSQTITAEVVKSKKDREQGLAGRESLGINEGMLFLFDKSGHHGFWMKGMKFPIDIIWISEDAIVGFEENIDPQIGVNPDKLKIYYPPQEVNKVLEVSAGRVKLFKAQIGDIVKIRPLVFRNKGK